MARRYLAVNQGARTRASGIDVARIPGSPGFGHYGSAKMFGRSEKVVRAVSVAVIFGCALTLFACAENEPTTDEERMQQDTTMRADPIASGRDAYMTYCGSCHGQEGKGDGPVADVMTVQPADLTQIRAEHEGSFPVDSIYAYIDGRADVQAHGTRAMPVWGNVWGEVDGDPVPREEVDRRIRELVEYIRSIQEEPAS